MSREWEQGSTSAWRRLRARVLAENQERNQGRCTLQLDVCTGHADTVHHVLGRSVTGDDPRFLAAVCAACNLKAGDPTKHSPPLKRITKW